MKVIENKSYNSFQEFFNDVLSPSGNMYDKTKSFIYRGESSNTFELLPSVLRTDKKSRENIGFYTIKGYSVYENENEFMYRNEGHQIWRELKTICDFYKRANLNGLIVPSIDNMPLDNYDNWRTYLSGMKKPFKWIRQEFREIAALAQHYGIPTRLIDWTFDIYIALYFASVGACEKSLKNDEINADEKIVVWALDANYIQDLETYKKTPLKFVVPNYSGNPNLNAQKGILSYWEIECEPQKEENKDIDRTPLDKLLLHQLKDSKEERVVLYKLEIPFLEASKVFEYILRIGYTAGRLFPGYTGIAKEMNEQELFYRVMKNVKL